MQVNLSQQTLHFRKVQHTPWGEFDKHEMIVIHIMDDKGQRIGLGECAPLPQVSSDSNAYLRMSDVAKLINGALNGGDHTEVLRPYPALLFALESAMYDYQHNSLLYETDFAHSQVGIPTNSEIFVTDYDDTLSQVKQRLLHGIHSVTLQVCPQSLDDTIKVLEKLRSRFSASTLELRINANGTLSSSDIMPFLQEIAKYDVQSMAQPIKRYQWNDMAGICSKSPLPIVLDDELVGVNTLQEKCTLLDTVKPQFITVRPMLHGGISGSIEWVSEARKRDIGVYIGSAFEGNIGLRNVALLAACVNGGAVSMPQPITSESLYTDNIEMDIEFRKGKLWRCEVDE